MKKTPKVLILVAVAFVMGLVGLSSTNFHNANDVSVKDMGDNKGVFVGAKGDDRVEKRASKIHSKLVREQEQHHAELRAIEEAWVKRREARVHYENKEYDQAIKKYKEAYEISLNKVLYGVALVKAYEKLARYDDALAALEDITSKVSLSEYGEKRFDKIRARLIAARKDVPGTNEGSSNQKNQKVPL